MATRDLSGIRQRHSGQGELIAWAIFIIVAVIFDLIIGFNVNWAGVEVNPVMRFVYNHGKISAIAFKAVLPLLLLVLLFFLKPKKWHSWIVRLLGGVTVAIAIMDLAIIGLKVIYHV